MNQTATRRDMQSSPGTRHAAKIVATYDFELTHSDGRVERWSEKNIVTDQGLNSILDIMFSGGTQITDWYVVLSESNTTPAAGMTYAAPVFTEITAYDESTRPLWVESGVSNKTISNAASRATFTFNATKTIYASGVVGGGSAASTKGDTAGGGILYSYAAFTSGSRGVESGSVIKIVVTLSAQDA